MLVFMRRLSGAVTIRSVGRGRRAMSSIGNVRRLAAMAAAGRGTNGDKPAAATEVKVDRSFWHRGFKVSDVHRYSFRLTAPRAVYRQGMAEGCNHLVRWAITRSDGSPVLGGETSCGTDGPIALGAGDYVLRIGGDRTGGKYAFLLSAK
jgi:hypothetical protein